MPIASRAGLSALALATTALFSACGGDDTSAASTTAAATSTTGAGATNASTTVAGMSIDVVYKNGKVQGATKYSVKKGEQVSITITADISDEVHVHGYDKTAKVTPNAPAVITFIADRQGKYEVEFEKKHSLIFELEVR